MARKTKKEAAATKVTILDAAIRIILERGISRTTLDDIALEAGVTRGAIYWHFTNKVDLLRTLWAEILKENDFDFQAIDGKDESDPLGFLIKQLSCFLKQRISNTHRRQLFHLFLTERILPDNTDSFHFYRKSLLACKVKKIENILCDAINKRQLPANIDVCSGAIAIVSYIDGLVPHYWLLAEEFGIKINTPYLINALMQILCFGCIRQNL